MYQKLSLLLSFVFRQNTQDVRYTFCFVHHNVNHLLLKLYCLSISNMLWLVFVCLCLNYATIIQHCCNITRRLLLFQIFKYNKL